MFYAIVKSFEVNDNIFFSLVYFILLFCFRFSNYKAINIMKGILPYMALPEKIHIDKDTIRSKQHELA